MNKKPKIKIDLKDFLPIEKGDCKRQCERQVIKTKTGPIVVCFGCKRIIMDNRI